MPPLPFPYPLKVGVDICHIPRVARILTRNVGEGKRSSQPLSHFLTRVFTWPERQYFWDRFHSPSYAYEHVDRVSQYIAGRWAVKEACRKACNHFGRSNGLHHIMVVPASSNGTSSAPVGLVLRDPLHPLLTDPEKGIRVRLRGTDKSNFEVNAVEGQFCEISITHDAGIAQAVAMVPTITWSGDSVQGATWKNVGDHDGWAMDLELQDSRPI